MYDQREKTISRSSILYGTSDDDVWFSLEQFYKDQIQEVNQKLAQLDDEIWGKIILMEKNKRVAKAYVRTARFRVDGSCHEFDGQRIGFKSLNNPARDSTVEEIREKIGIVLFKLDPQGNIWLKRCDGSSPVIVQGWDRLDAHCHGADVHKIRGRLDADKMIRVFDMRLFKSAIDRELSQPYPDRKKLLYKTAVRVSLVKEEPHPFKTPCWFMLINLVALDMLNANVPPGFPAVPSENPGLQMSRCQSMAGDLQQAGKQLTVSSNNLYGCYLSPPTIFREAASPVWSDDATTSGDSSTSPNPCGDTVPTSEMANSLALGCGGGYGAVTRPRWSTLMARSMDCLYGAAAAVMSQEPTVQQQPRCLPTSVDSPRKEQVQCRPIKVAATVHQQRDEEKDDPNPYVKSIRPIGRRVTVLTISDSESSSSSGGRTGPQQDIYVSSSRNSSNSSSEVSCRPSSPSISSEASSCQHSADSTVACSIGHRNRNSALSFAQTTNRGNSLCRSAAPPEPPPRPQMLLKKALRSKLFGLLNPRSEALDTKHVAVQQKNAMYNRNGEHPIAKYGIKKSAWTTRGWVFHGSDSNKEDSRSSDSDFENCRL